MFILNRKNILWLVSVWVAFSTLLMIVGGFERNFAWLNVGVIIGSFFLLPSIDRLRLFILCIPLYVVLPNYFSETLNMWRVVLIALAGIECGVICVELFKFPLSFWNLFERFKSLLRTWDVWFIGLLVWALCTLLFARFPGHGLRQVVFVINIYAVYWITRRIVKSREDVKKIFIVIAISTGLIVVVGYFQLVLSIVMDQYYFWQYWAIRVSSLYYGDGLGRVLSYSNSWFSYSGGERELRMFSVMGDSHSFAVISVFFIMSVLPFVVNFERCMQALSIPVPHKRRWKYALWYLIRASGLAVVLSGTRGVWVGMLVPFFVSVYLYLAKQGRFLIKKTTLAMAFILLFFLLSPVINSGLHMLRLGFAEDNLIGRAASIYDLSEESNVGRLVIWRDSLMHVLKHPLGTGAGNFITSVVDSIPSGATYAHISQERNTRYNLPQEFITAHNLYLEIFVELGVIGILLFAGFVWSIADAFIKFWRAHREDKSFEALAIVSIGMVFLWLMGYAFFDVTLLNERVLIYAMITLALLAKLLEIIFKRNDESNHNPAGIQ